MGILHFNYNSALRACGLIALLLLGACHRLDNYVADRVDPKLPCKVQGACDATIIGYLRYFKKSNVQVVTMGQNYLISIPAQALFEPETPHIKWGSYKLLNQVAGFLKQFRKVGMTVTSFSDKYVSTDREHALTKARARVVAEYLWTQGVDSRFIFTQGLGSDKPIANVTQGVDMPPNARIEITFRRAVA